MFSLVSKTLCFSDLLVLRVGETTHPWVWEVAVDEGVADAMVMTVVGVRVVGVRGGLRIGTLRSGIVFHLRTLWFLCR